MSARYTEEQASKLNVVEPSLRFIKPRKTAQEIRERLELEAVREKIVPKAEPPKGNKYRNKKVVMGSLKFDSKKEHARYLELRQMEQNQLITDLKLQHAIQAEVNGKKVFKYIADFAYLRDGKQIFEDSKGFRTPVFRLKKRILAALGIEILET